MGENGQIPEMILIGVDLPEGNSILLPTRDKQDTTIPDGYIDFFEAELMPHVDHTYRTAPFNVLYGASNSGFFSVYTLLNNPLLFNGYFASSPSLSQIPEVLQEKIKAGPLKTLRRNRSLHIIYSDDENLADHVSKFTSVLAEHKPEGCFTYKVDELVNQGHVPAMDFTQFLLALYPDFNPYENLDTLDKVTQHFDMLSKRYGYEIQPSISMIFNLGADMIRSKDLVVAEKIFQYSLQAYPEGKESYVGMGVVHRNQGRFEQAKVLFEKALTLDPEYALAKRLLERLDISKLALLSRPIPTDTSLVFAPGIISTEDSFESPITFNSDMTELFFGRKKPKEKIKIYTMKLIDGTWSKPELASFSLNKEYSDYRPRLNPKGDVLYFSSKRPLKVGTESTGSHHQWSVKKDESGWGQPIPVEEPFIDRPIVDLIPSENGNLYFSANKKNGKPEDEGVYYSINQDGQYTAIKRMGNEINSPDNWTCCPYIAPDESYIIYDGATRASGFGGADLYISFNKNGNWTKSYNLGPRVNTKYGEGTATVSPDGKYLFFYRSTVNNGDIYWVDFTQLKKEIIENINSN